jgi:Adenylate and Guanylate cyclase catalytic domain
MFISYYIAARMESTSAPDKIQISRATAEILKTNGKDHWVKPRNDIVHAKGLGAMQTFWLQIGTKKGYSVTSSQEDVTASEGTRSTDLDEPGIVRQQQQLVNWVVELLLSHIQTMVSIKHWKLLLSFILKTINENVLLPFVGCKQTSNDTA